MTTRLIRSMVALGIVIGLAMVAFLSLARDGDSRPAVQAIYEPFFQHLTATRVERKQEILAYFEAAHRAAKGVVEDPVMVKWFFERLNKRDQKPDPQDDADLDEHFVDCYNEFYDVLFVDRNGYVFHSIRYEPDLGMNLFKGKLAHTKLAQRLRTANELIFVDYEMYLPSDEPAAFFAVPVWAAKRVGDREDLGDAAGWFVLQCPLNKLHSILSNRRSLGRTGETYLVNAERRMLTASRFRPKSVVLHVKVDTQAVAAALESGEGEQIITGYRGIRVLSSYEAFRFRETRWVIVASMHEDEVITDHLRKHEAYYYEEIARYLERHPPKSPALSKPAGTIKLVDMNEFRKAARGTVLYTGGVTTCTAVTAVLPGQFGYLAHVGPSDRIYGEPDMGHNDCLGEMLHQLQWYDVYPYQISQLEFTIVAAHTRSIAGAVRELLNVGVELSQIRFVYNPRAEYESVILVPDKNVTQIEWMTSAGDSTRTLVSDVENLGSIVRRTVANPK